VPYRTPSQKLAGDPGIFGTLGKIFGTVAKVGVSLLPGPIGMAARGAVGLLTPAQQAGRLPATPPFRPPVVPGGARLIVPIPSGTSIGRGGAVPGTLIEAGKKRRRMDPMNVKALRRATRRLASFDREKKKVEKQLRLIAPRPARRSRRDVPPGHGHVR
jgi:hypothetical protein